MSASEGQILPQEAGGLLSFKDGVLRGWASPVESMPAIVELVAGDRVLAETLATDMSVHGDETGFALALPALARPEKPVTAILRVRNRGMFPGGKIVLEPDDFRHPEPPPILWPKLPWRLGPDEVEGYVDGFGPVGIHGWAQCPERKAEPVIFELREDGTSAGTFRADQWRNDLQETRQGDGRWGIDAPIPPSLRDGRLHVLHAFLADGTPALAHPVALRFLESDTRLFTPAIADRDDPRPKRHPRPRAAGEDVVFSFIVVFYNMNREAARTLHSLSRAYQQDIGALKYEVICIDNGSNPPLDADFVASFGPEFRLIRPDPLLPSPCRAINDAARQAKGHHVAIMIDGAHMLSPGVLREAWDTITESPDTVVGLRPWFVGGDQRFLASAGYTREQEDTVFQRIEWPADGYRLFEIGSPYWESPNTWFDAMIESNCLFVPASLYASLGGIDEAFDEPGAGFANLDLFRRVADTSPEQVTVLIGEATFHQFHEAGTTTNVAVAEKESRVRTYESRYTSMRGKLFVSSLTVDLRVRGQLKTKHAMIARQRPLSRVELGVTDRIRHGSLPHHFDEPAQEYLQSTYVECGLFEEPTWLGQKTGVAPADSMQMADLIFRLRPDRIVGANIQPGLVSFLDTALGTADLPTSRIIVTGPEKMKPASQRVTFIKGPAADGHVQAKIADAIGGADNVLVILSPDPDDYFPVQTLHAYARFVTLRSYLIVVGTALGQPWLGYSKRWYRKAIQLLLDGGQFAVDPGCTRQLVTISPGGYLQRIGSDSEAMA